MESVNDVYRGWRPLEFIFQNDGSRHSGINGYDGFSGMLDPSAKISKLFMNLGETLTKNLGDPYPNGLVPLPEYRYYTKRTSFVAIKRSEKWVMGCINNGLVVLLHPSITDEDVTLLLLKMP